MLVGKKAVYFLFVSKQSLMSYLTATREKLEVKSELLVRFPIRSTHISSAANPALSSARRACNVLSFPVFHCNWATTHSALPCTMASHQPLLEAQPEEIVIPATERNCLPQLLGRRSCNYSSLAIVSLFFPTLTEFFLRMSGEPKYCGKEWGWVPASVLAAQLWIVTSSWKITRVRRLPIMLLLASPGQISHLILSSDCKSRELKSLLATQTAVKSWGFIAI